MDTVFYSWQSDLDPKTNRFFIGDALEKAVKLLKRDGLEVDPRIDQDARDCPGAPDIAVELFRKISTCRVFVADVSIINAGAFVGVGGKKMVGLSKEGVVYKHRQEKPCRPTPNPNVMIELGYAARALNWDRVICVINEAYSSVEKLPFDIRPRGMVRFNLLPTASEEERTAKKTKLRDHLKLAVELAIARNEAEIAALKAEASRVEEQYRLSHAILEAFPVNLHVYQGYRDGDSHVVVEMVLTFRVVNTGGVACTNAGIGLELEGESVEKYIRTPEDFDQLGKSRTGSQQPILPTKYMQVADFIGFRFNASEPPEQQLTKCLATTLRFRPLSQNHIGEWKTVRLADVPQHYPLDKQVRSALEKAN